MLISQYICSILPVDQVEKLRLYLDYQELLWIKVEQEEIQNHLFLILLNSTNNVRFSEEKVPVKTHYRYHHHHHHRSKRLILFIVGTLAVLVLRGGTVYDTVKEAQLRSLEVSVFTIKNSTMELARSFEKSQILLRL